MNILVDISESIKVRISPTPKKKKADPTTYDVYILYTITENGVQTIVNPTISTGLAVKVNEWDKLHKCLKGKAPNANLINAKLTKLVNASEFHLTNWRSENVKTCSQVKAEILSGLKTQISGKAKKGKKVELVFTQKQKTVEAVMLDFFRVRNQSEERQRIIQRAIRLLHQYFNNNTPLITNISENDLHEFKVWFTTKFRTVKGTPPAQDTQATWLNMIASVFLHAHKRMKILRHYPLPEGFRVAWVQEHDKPVMNEQECLNLINLADENLSETEQIAKYTLHLQLTTGMGLGDLSCLTLKHLKRDNKEQRWFIEKPRNKNGKIFKVPLTSRAKHSLDKLRKLTGGTDYLFNLPTLDYTNREYKVLTEKAEVQTHVTTYTLRHTFSVDYMNNDGRLEDLSKMLGNDIKYTAKYGRVTNQRLAEKATVLEQKSLMHQV